MSPDAPLHFGDLLQQVRYARHLRRIDVARLAGVSAATVTRLEENGATSPATVEAYLAGLQMAPIPDALSDGQLALLRDLYRHERERSPREQLLAGLGFGLGGELGPSRHVDEALADVFALVRCERRPAALLDPLFYLRAVNRPFLDLFGIAPDDPFLQRWEAWHAISCHLLADSPYRVCELEDHFVAGLIRGFFESTMPFLFCRQHRALVAGLVELSPHRFRPWWRQAVSLSMPDHAALPCHAVVVNGAPAWIVASVVAEVDRGESEECRARYLAVAWDGIYATRDGQQGLVTFRRQS